MVGGRDAQRRLAEEEPERRVLAVHQREDRLKLGGMLRGRAGPVGRVAGRLDQRHLHPELGHLLRKGRDRVPNRSAFSATGVNVFH